ncbi:tRNA adenosine(34) deaminase TadA [Caldalkalibacillus salinus]|uniref:tRNA adenosine(34) deaminase TadA n=1 Tax=Caldalkalibacillus salinus TaxID=2803787 RepID=UPI00192394BA|nr:tRNA adenosine(34) deaminase TadA [Caldalkalibacillus salinus]
MDQQACGRSEHDKYMAEAIEWAKIAETYGEIPIGAVIVKDEQIIGTGYNRRETDRNPLGHAEIMAINEAARHLGGWRLENCTLYVTLEPCPMCAGAIIQSRITTLVYGTDDPKSGYAGSLYNVLQDERLNHQADVIPHIRQLECQCLLKDFFRRLRQSKKQEKQSRTEYE